VDEVRFRGLQTCVKEALNKLSNCDLIYISFDVDSMDCDMISYGTGTPFKGFDQHEVIAIINKLLSLEKLFVLKLWR
jgi:arginase